MCSTAAHMVDVAHHLTTRSDFGRPKARSHTSSDLPRNYNLRYRTIIRYRYFMSHVQYFITSAVLVSYIIQFQVILVWDTVGVELVPYLGMYMYRYPGTGTGTSGGVLNNIRVRLYSTSVF